MYSVIIIQNEAAARILIDPILLEISSRVDENGRVVLVPEYLLTKIVKSANKSFVSVGGKIDYLLGSPFGMYVLLCEC